MKNRILSLIIPTKNRSNVLLSLLLTLNDQQGNFEVIIVDDASIDDTRKKVKNLSSKLNYNLIYVRSKHQLGLPAARNVGINYSNYKIIGFLDDDCIPINKTLLMRAIRWLNLKNSNIIGVGGPVYTRTTVPTLSIPKIRGIKSCIENIEILIYKPLILRFANTLRGGNLFLKKELVEICGKFDTNFDGNYYREDTDLCMNMKKYGNLVSDPKMPVNHLNVNYGGCRRNISEFYSNVLSNTTLLVMKHKKILIEVFLDTFLHILTFLTRFITGKEDDGTKIKRIKTLFSIIQGIIIGLKKYFSNNKEDKEIIIEEVIKFKQ